MTSQQQKFALNQQKSISLISSYLFFELLSFKKFQQTSFFIPDIILLDKGMIKQWLFNSVRQQNKILKKRKENNTPLNVVKSFCFKSGYNFSHINTFTQLITEYSAIKKQESRKQPVVLKTLQDKKVIEIITLDDEFLSVTLSEFLNLVNENNFNEHSFYDKWKIIREKINNESKIQECYEVISSRKNHAIQSKCHKIISVKTSEITPVSTAKFSFAKHETQDNQTKNLEGYKFFDTFLNKKFFGIVQELIEFIEKNYKCIVEEIRTKYVINKNREPHFVGIYSLKVKPAKKLISQDEFQRFSQKDCIRVEDYMKFLTNYLYEIQNDNNIHMALTVNITKKSKCHGEFCKMKVKKHSIFSDPSQNMNGRSKHFNLDPAVVPAYKKLVPSDIVNEIHKKKQKIMQKLKQHDIIESNSDEWAQNQSDYQSSDEQQLKNVKVCENCYSIYIHIQKFYEIDFRSGNLVEKKQSILNDQTLRIRSQSQKRFLPILKKFQLENQTNDEKMSLGTISMINKDETPRKEEKTDFKQIQTNEKTKSISQRARSHTKLQSSNQKIAQFNIKKVSDLKKIKLDPIQRLIQNGPSKGNRLLELAKSTQGVQQFIQSVKFKKQKVTTNQGKIAKAKNFQQAESNLLSQFKNIQCYNKEQFIYFAMKYARDNIPQQLDRQCFSSQYLSSLYQFMMNSDLNLHSKNRIKKRPEISLKRLSELTDYPEIVSKSAFHFDTIITDEKTTIPFCVITTKMINGKNAVNIPYENVFICQDIFDSFIEYIPLVKDILDNAVNKRIILFNYPGQSHTIFNSELPFNLLQSSFILDKLFFRLSTEKEQLGFVNFRKDKFKFIGFGFGGYLLSTYLDNNCEIFGKQNLTGILLVNAYKKITEILKEKGQKLRILYQNDDKMTIPEAHLFYNKAIHSSETDKEDVQYKSGLNPIRNTGRVYLLESLLDMYAFENNHHDAMIQSFQNISFCPVHIMYGSKNVLFPKSHTSSLLKFQETNNEKVQIHNFKLIKIKGGHDLLADNYEDLQKYIEQFINL